MAPSRSGSTTMVFTHPKSTFILAAAKILGLKWSGSFFKTNIFYCSLYLSESKKYFAKNLELFGPRNLLFSTAASATKLQFGI